MDGNQTIAQSLEVHQETLHTVFERLYLYRVPFEQMILKPSMVISGTDCAEEATV